MRSTSAIGKRLLKAAPVILSVALLTLAAERLGWLDHFETGGIDTVLLLRAPRESPNITIVAIDDSDYAALFHATSPLDPKMLQRIVQAIAEGGAAVIAVDVDTSPSADRRINLRTSPTIVWARDASIQGNNVTLYPALGGRSPNAANLFGIASIPLDWDGVVRHYMRVYNVGSHLYPSLPWAAVQAYCADGGRWICHNPARAARATSDPLLINFTGERYLWHPLSAQTVLTAAQGADWKRTMPFRGQIVVLGGVFRLARDVQPTPLGQMAGAEIIAQIIQSELNGSVRPLSWMVALILDLLIGALLVAMNFYFSVRVATALTVVALPLFSLLASFVAFASFGFWLNFVPMILAVLVHQLYERSGG